MLGTRSARHLLRYTPRSSRAARFGPARAGGLQSSAPENGIVVAHRQWWRADRSGAARSSWLRRPHWRLAAPRARLTRCNEPTRALPGAPWLCRWGSELGLREPSSKLVTVDRGFCLANRTHAGVS